MQNHGVGERRLIDATLLRGAEASRLDAESARLREIYDGPRRARQDLHDQRPRQPRRSGHGTGPRRHRRATLQGPGEMNPKAIVGNDARPRNPLIAAGQDQPRRLGRGDLLDPDGRSRRTLAATSSKANALSVANLDV